MLVRDKPSTIIRKSFYLRIGDSASEPVTFDFDITRGTDVVALQALDHQMTYEHEVTLVMYNTLRPGDFVIDVGANVGFHTILMSRMVGSGGCVLAVEPQPDILPHLDDHIRLNRCANVGVIPRPLWCRQESVTMYVESDSGGGGTALWDAGKFPANVKTRQEKRTFTCDATTLDAICGDRTPRLIKMNTEGADEMILRGGLQVLSRRPPFIISEFNPFGMAQLGCSQQTLRKFMEGYDYDAFLIADEARLPTLVPRNTEITYGQSVVINIMFSTPEAVGACWPKAPYDK